MGLPKNTRNEALMHEAEADTCQLLAYKCAVSLYLQINPENEMENSIAKILYKKDKPIWANYLEHIPTNIWKQPIEEISKKILKKENITVDENSIANQNEAEKIETKYKFIVYTDASVNISSNPPGDASIGHIWFTQKMGLGKR